MPSICLLLYIVPINEDSLNVHPLHVTGHKWTHNVSIIIQDSCLFTILCSCIAGQVRAQTNVYQLNKTNAASQENKFFPEQYVAKCEESNFLLKIG